MLKKDLTGPTLLEISGFPTQLTLTSSPIPAGARSSSKTTNSTAHSQPRQRGWLRCFHPPLPRYDEAANLKPAEYDEHSDAIRTSRIAEIRGHRYGGFQHVIWLQFQSNSHKSLNPRADANKLNTMGANLVQRYICVNPLCRCQILATRASLDTQGNPRCRCGAEMKKPYSQPLSCGLSRQPTAFAARKKHSA